MNHFERLEIGMLPTGSVLLVDVDGDKTYKFVVCMDDDILEGTKYCIVSRLNTEEDNDEELLGEFIISELRVGRTGGGVAMPARTPEVGVIKLGAPLTIPTVKSIEAYMD